MKNLMLSCIKKSGFYGRKPFPKSATVFPILVERHFKTTDVSGELLLWLSS